MAILGAVGWGLAQVFRAGAVIYGRYHAMYQAHIEQLAARRTERDARYDGYLNLLFFGLDDGPAGAKPTADTLLFLSLDRASGRLRLLSVPRGTLVNAESGPVRLGDVYRIGGSAAALQAMDDLLGVSIHHYLALGTKTLVQIIDAAGGIGVYVETPMDYEDPEAGLAIHLPQGYRHMDGETALKYLRYRGQEFGDMGRVRRQQAFVKAVYAQLTQIDILPKLPTILAILREQAATDIEVWDAAPILGVLRDFPKDAPEAAILPGHEVPGDSAAYAPNPEKIREKMEEFFPPLPEEAPRPAPSPTPSRTSWPKPERR